MERRHLKINKVFITVIVLISMCSCNNKSYSEQNNNFKKAIFKDNSFKKELDNFIKDLNLIKENPDESMIVTLYINKNSDTIVSITNFKPYETVNLVAVNSYEKYKLYFYASKGLLGTLNKFIDVKNGYIQETALKPVDEGEIDPMHTYSLYIKNDKIVP